MQAGKVAVTTAVARSKKYIVSAQNDKGNDIKADVPVIKGIASGNLSVSTTGGKNQKVVFDGPNAVTFGVQAAQLRFDQSGVITALDQIAAGTGMAAKPKAKGPVSRGWLPARAGLSKSVELCCRPSRGVTATRKS